jgi:hypothetical protein
VIYLAGFQLADRRIGEAKTDLEQVGIPGTNLFEFMEGRVEPDKPLEAAPPVAIVEAMPPIRQPAYACNSGAKVVSGAARLEIGRERLLRPEQAFG